MSSFMSPCFPSLNLRWSLPRSWTKRKCSILIILWAVTMCRPTIITTAPSCRNSTACCLRFLQATIPAWVCPRLRLRITGRNLYRQRAPCRLACAVLCLLYIQQLRHSAFAYRDHFVAEDWEGLSVLFTVGAASLCRCRPLHYPECRHLQRPRKATDGARAAPLPGHAVPFLPPLTPSRSKCALEHPCRECG